MLGGGYLVDLRGGMLQLITEYINHQTPTSSIKNVYVVPKIFINQTLPQGSLYTELTSMYLPLYYNYQVAKPTSVNGYTPRNKKLLTYPYCYMVLSNNGGVTNILHYEKFKSQECNFVIAGIPTPRLLY